MEHYVSNDKWCIYYHKNKINGKVYLGQTNNTYRRFSYAGIYYKGCKYFYNAIQKYGWDNFEHEILIKDLTKQQADIIEKELIKKFNLRNNENGYNIAEGGNLFHPPSGKEHPLSKTVYRYDLSGNYIDEWENAPSASNVLNIKADLIRNSARNNGTKKAGEYLWSYIKKDKLPKFVQVNYSNAKKTYPRVYQIDFNGNIQKIYDDIHCVNHYECIVECCNGNMLSYSGSFWLFEDDYSENKVRQLIDTKCIYRKICMYDLSGVHIKTFASKNEAADYTKYNMYIIYETCRTSHTHRYGDYLWYFFDDTNGENVQHYSKSHTVKSILQYSQNGNFIEKYDQIKFAIEKYGTTINKALKSKSHYAYGFLWFYESEYEDYINQFNLKDDNINDGGDI